MQDSLLRSMLRSRHNIQKSKQYQTNITQAQLTPPPLCVKRRLNYSIFKYLLSKQAAAFICPKICCRGDLAGFIMAKKLSLIVLGDSSTALRRFCISQRQLIAIAAGLLVCVVVVVFCLVQYALFQSRQAQRHALEHQLRRQTAEMELQRLQIQQFAAKIGGLKQQLLTLNQLESEIRTIAHINPQGHLDDVFAVGGSVPHDFNAQIESAREYPGVMNNMYRPIEQADDIDLDQHIPFESVLKALHEEKNLLAHTPSIRPAAGRVSSRFGYRKSPYSEALEFHKGIDIANLRGTPVVATAEGMVSFIGSNGTSGRMMVIDHGFGITTRYAHIDESLKKPGDRVCRGDQIALMGGTGGSSDARLHYEVRLHGVPVNPDQYISD
jgi:murein DD-endopeptidase MepM/ murein hydrolase activator NlpD